MSQYKWGAGFNLALVALSDVAEQLGPYNYVNDGDNILAVGVKSTPIDPFPVRDVPLSGKTRGDGMVTAQWTIGMTARAYQYALNTYWGGRTGTVAVPMTIYTYLHEVNEWGRANAYGARPFVADDGMQYIRGGKVIVVFTFNDLVWL